MGVDMGVAGEEEEKKVQIFGTVRDIMSKRFEASHNCGLAVISDGERRGQARVAVTASDVLKFLQAT
jgi:hypothetical protein